MSTDPYYDRGIDGVAGSAVVENRLPGAGQARVSLGCASPSSSTPSFAALR